MHLIREFEHGVVKLGNDFLVFGHLDFSGGHFRSIAAKLVIFPSGSRIGVKSM